MTEVTENIFSQEEALGSISLLTRAMTANHGGLRESEVKAASKILAEVHFALVDIETITIEETPGM